MKVCIISPIFHPLIGGPGGQALMMARKLILKGMDVLVISRRLSGIDFKVEDIEVHYVSTFSPHVHSLSKFTMRNFLISISFALGAMMKVLKLRKRFEIVQFYGASLPLLICLPMLKILNKKLVAKTTGGRGGKEAGGLDDFFLKQFMIGVFRYTDKFIAINNDIRLRLHNEGYAEEKIIYIPNGVDVNIFYPYEQEKKDRMRKDSGLIDKKIIVYCGRLAEGKGLEILLEALKIVVMHDKNAYLIMLGDGPLKGRLNETAVYLGISNNVNFKGNVKNVYEFLNIADFFVLPSFSEGMPNSLLEAMACGLPVIASKIGGVNDVVEDGKSGILFEPGDVAGLSSAMIKLLKDDGLRRRLGAEARKIIVDNFSIDKIADEYIKLYGNLISQS